MKADFLFTQFKTEAQTKYAIDNSHAVELYEALQVGVSSPSGLVHRRYHLLQNHYFTNTNHKVIGGRNNSGHSHEISFDSIHEEEPVDGMISRVHFKLQWLPVDDAVSIEDLNSTNGTFINDKKLKPLTATVLKKGDTIKVGETELLFEREDINTGEIL